MTRVRDSLKKRPDARRAAGRRKKAQRGTRKVPFERRIEGISSMKLEELAGVIKEASEFEDPSFESTVIDLCLRRILKHMDPQSDRHPRAEQVYTLRRLIFLSGDALLVARTGFGKSIIFHAYTVLTGKITIQIIPLNKLGAQQLHDIEHLGVSSPCLVTADTKANDPKLLDRIQAGEHRHILISPEQAASKAFRKILSTQKGGGNLASRIGLVVIDECHLVEQWKDFRAHFTMLYQLRAVLRRDTVWFGCTATLSAEAEAVILGSSGFRPIGDSAYETEVIRTSIDRSDISISFTAIPRGLLATFDRLYYVLNEAIDEETQTITPQKIPKTLLFIDSVKKAEALANWFHHALVAKTAQWPVDKGYYARCGHVHANVFNIVQTYHSHVSKTDQQIRFGVYEKEGCLMRICVATTSMGMGINIADIDRVIIWKLPIGLDPSELWQRAGRGGRGEGRTSIVHVFVPYWVFDLEGVYKEGTEEPAKRPLPYSRVPKTMRHLLRADRQLIRQATRLSQVESVDDVYESDAESVASQSSRDSVATYDSQASVESEGHVDQDQDIPTATEKVKYWRKQELKSRENLPNIWKEICNGKCKRAPLINFLGEDRLLEGVERNFPPKGKCCNGCNPALEPQFIRPLSALPAIVAPTATSRAAAALTLLDQWAAECADELYYFPTCRFHMPLDTFLRTKSRWQLARLYSRTDGVKEIEWAELDWDKLVQKAPLMDQWEHRQEWEVRLLHKLKDLTNDVDAEFDRQKQVRATEKAKKDAKNAREEIHVASVDTTGMTPQQALCLHTQKKQDSISKIARLARVSAGVGASLSETHASSPSSRPRARQAPSPPPAPPRTPTPANERVPSTPWTPSFPAGRTRPFPRETILEPRPSTPTMLGTVASVLNLTNTPGTLALLRQWYKAGKLDTPSMSRYKDMLRASGHIPLETASKEVVPETQLGPETTTRAESQEVILETQVLDSQTVVLETQFMDQPPSSLPLEPLGHMASPSRRRKRKQPISYQTDQERAPRKRPLRNRDTNSMIRPSALRGGGNMTTGKENDIVFSTINHEP